MNRHLALCCIIFAVAVSFSTLFTSHAENDEQVFITLAKRITCTHSHCFLFDFKQYNLLGSNVLKNLTEPEYKRPVFFHPPAALMALSLANRVGGEWGMKILPIFQYFIIAFIIYKTLLLFDVSKTSAEYGALLSLCSPLLLFNAQKIWMDLFMGCMLIISFYFLLLFIKKKKRWAILLSGLFFFLAVFTKYWAIVSFVPFVTLLIVFLRKKSFIPILLFMLPLLFLVSNTLFQIIPVAAHPILNVFTQQRKATNNSIYPFLAYVTHRPFFYYLICIFLINPSYAFIGFMTKDVYKKITSERSFINSMTIFLLIFILYSLSIFSAIVLFGGGFQTRYIVFIEPFIILFVSLLIEKSNQKEFSLLILFLSLNILLVIINALFLNSAELFPFIEMLWVF